MRRFSQRNPLVVLSDINITPLLDLAFVLLIIFVISTPLLEQGMEVDLPSGGQADGEVRPGDIQTVDVTAEGEYFLQGEAMELDIIESRLVEATRTNSNTVVYIRADQSGEIRHTYAVIDRCLARNIHRFSLRTEREP